MARKDDLVIAPLDDELLVFDSRTHRAHSLNPAAAAVWRAADGTRTRDELAAHCSLDPLAVELALESLAGCDLLTGGFTRAAQRVSRRAALRRIALTGAAVGVTLPVIRSIAAPTAQAAGSAGLCPGGCPAGQFCDSTGNCHPGTPAAQGQTCSVFNQPPCASHSYCNYYTTCQPGLRTSHGPGHPCRGDMSCSVAAACSSGGICR